jgi:hypothetical protein
MKAAKCYCSCEDSLLKVHRDQGKLQNLYHDIKRGLPFLSVLCVSLNEWLQIKVSSPGSPIIDELDALALMAGALTFNSMCIGTVAQRAGQMVVRPGPEQAPFSRGAHQHAFQ